jgi:peptidyl-prolyl cis-trans isomerase D
VRKDPKSFAQVAKANSQDPGSAANGGDLGYFGRDAMVKPFEEAVFKMKQGDISDVVESDFGFHIIELTGIKQPKVPSFEEMRPKLEADSSNNRLSASLQRRPKPSPTPFTSSPKASSLWPRSSS